jgi:Ser/Thr protein kinase RdoA (MazF antagonist)
MVYMSTLLAAMDAVEKEAYYTACANAVLVHYDLGSITPHFVQHNAGIVFRLDDAQGAPHYLLKIHESAGDSLADTPEQLAAQMAWLQALTDDGRVIVQSPKSCLSGHFTRTSAIGH